MIAHPYRDGFGLVEVMVALLILAIAMLGLVRVVAAAVEVMGTAESRRRALEAVGAIAQTALPDIDYPSGRRPVGDPGADGLPGTGDDLPPTTPGCERQIDVLASGAQEWVWVRSWCGTSRAPSESPSAAAAKLLVAR